MNNAQAQAIAQAVLEALTYSDDRGNRVWVEEVNGADFVEAMTAALAEHVEVLDEPVSD